MSLAHRDDYYETPQWLFDDIKNKTRLNFDMDACASLENRKCRRYCTEEFNILNYKDTWEVNAIWCNPPRSKNGKFVDYMVNLWNTQNHDIVMLLCWNDLGNKYGEKVLEHILCGDFEVENLGKIKFYKNGKESPYPSRLTYFWCWMKKRDG